VQCLAAKRSTIACSSLHSIASSRRLFWSGTWQFFPIKTHALSACCPAVCAPWQLDPPLPPGALDGVTLVMSEPGASCDAACAAASSTCSQPHFPLLDSCDRLREVVNCEAGCVAEEPEFTMPYYVDPDAPKPSRPALCLVRDKKAAAAEDSKKAGCGDSDTHQRRLCPCKKGSGPD
jgi:hypothetical protein